MKRTPPAQRKTTDQGSIGELMLAKTMLEEKNELIDRKDEVIRELQIRQKQLKCELADTRQELEASCDQLEVIREEAARAGKREAISEVVRLVADYEGAIDSPESGVHLYSRLIRLFREQYGLEVIEQTEEEIDPEVHRVIEVVDRPMREEQAERTSRFQVLAKGYRVDGKVVRPALVKVFGEPPEGA